MSNHEELFGYLATVPTMALLFFVGYMALFRTQIFMSYYLNIARRNYLNSVKKKSFLGKCYRAAAKYQLQCQERAIQSRSSQINIKVVGVAAIFMGLLILCITLHTIFNISLGIFTTAKFRN